MTPYGVMFAIFGFATMFVLVFFCARFAAQQWVRRDASGVVLGGYMSLISVTLVVCAAWEVARG